MFIARADAPEKRVASGASVREYPFPSESLSHATAEIDGRYPESGRARNAGCEQTYFVLSGRGTIRSEKGDFPIAQGDCYHFEKGERYWVDGADLRVAIANSPRWTPDQYEIVE